MTEISWSPASSGNTINLSTNRPLESWVKDYYPIFKPLLDLGILEEHSSSFSREEHRCRFFRLNLPTEAATSGVSSDTQTSHNNAQLN